MKSTIRNAQKLIRAAVPAMAIFAAVTAHAVSYQIDVTTAYGFSNPVPGNAGDFSDAGVPSPDTGFWNVTNSGTTTFSGTIGQIALSPGAGDSSYSHIVTLAPGQSVSFAVNSESSNVGGFNGGAGVQIYLNGFIDGSDAVSLSVNDADIHSGVFRSANGTNSDSYVLQGGDPFGGDTGDGFEVTQAPGHFQFRSAGVPDSGSTLLLLGSAVTGLGLLRRKLGA